MRRHPYQIGQKVVLVKQRKMLVICINYIKNITVNKHKFRLEIYDRLVDWEIFPHTYDAALYAFSNKDKLNKLVEKKYILQK